MLEIQTLVVTPFMQNARILGCIGTAEAVVIDPGGESDAIFEALQQRNQTCSDIWLTHSHIDHCGGVVRLKELTGARLWGHENERQFRGHVLTSAQHYGLPAEGIANCPEPDHYLVGGETLALGPLSFRVLFTPGHSPGHLCFYCESTGDLIAGDTLFAGSIGRTDLPGGNHQQLLRSIREQLMVLPDAVVVHSGHGEDTTIGAERETNPYLR